MSARATKGAMDVCKYCGERMGWPRPVGVVYGDRTAAHHACDERAEEAYQAASVKVPEPPTPCRADDDGDCRWPGCPQRRDGEPFRTGRTCPLWPERLDTDRKRPIFPPTS